MAQAIHGVSNFLKIITLSNYSLKTQLIVINIFTAVIGSIFLILINYFLLSNNNNLNNQIEKVADQSNKITNYLSNNAVRKLTQFNLEKCELNSASINDDCAEKIYSEPKLDPTFKIRSEERERYRLSVGVFRNSESKRQFFKHFRLFSPVFNFLTFIHPFPKFF